VLIAETRPVAERLRMREIHDDRGRRLVRIVHGGSGSVVTWRRPQTVLLSAQGMDGAVIAKVAFTSEDRVRDVGRRREIKKIANRRTRAPGRHARPPSAARTGSAADSGNPPTPAPRPHRTSHRSWPARGAGVTEIEPSVTPRDPGRPRPWTSDDACEVGGCAAARARYRSRSAT
jgi:hypothetical protein